MPILNVNTNTTHALRGIVAMLLAMGSFSMMDVSLKALSAHYPPLQVAALRGLTAWPLVVCYVWHLGQGAHLWRVRWPLHLLRGVLAVLMLSLFSYAIKTLSLTSAYVLFFIAPVLIALMSVPVLGEKIGWASIVAVVFGFGGVVVAFQPTADVWQGGMASLAVLAAAVCYTISAVAGRLLTRTDTPSSLVFWVTTALAVGGGALAWPDWVSLKPSDGPWLLLLGVTGMVGQVCIVEAFRHGHAAVVAPFEYSALAWSILFDAFIWQIWPQVHTLWGALLVILGGLILLYSLGKP
jgi:drug/metabolite transporter (DMT)-like permease